MIRQLAFISLAFVLAGCVDVANNGEGSLSPGVEWAIALHGGAGVPTDSLDESERQSYLVSLESALRIGREILASGGTSMDAVEKTIVFLEDNPLFNAGKGAVLNLDGVHELDASIMDGRTLACGAVAGVTTVKNPIVLARHVMADSVHVLLFGEGAGRFADEMNVDRVSQEYFHTEEARRELLEIQEGTTKDAWQGQSSKGTVGVAALDTKGDLAAGTSTGGLTGKRFGRVGDAPIIGAGTYANNKTCAISATGIGEEFIRYNVAHRISSLIEYRGASLQEAAEEVIMNMLRPEDGGIIGVGHDGSIALVFNTVGMFRGAADSSGRFEVKIWD